jgi:opacity protein-like surface antigen
VWSAGGKEIMKWLFAVVLPFLVPMADAVAQEVTAAMLDTGSLPGASSPRPRPDSVAEEVRDYAGRGTLETGFAYALIGFRSQPFNSTLSGVDTAVSYYFRDHLAVVGRVTSAWEIHSAHDADAKQVFYGGGLKLSWGNHMLQPFVNGLLGGVHMFPQTAFSKNGFGLQVGGGVEKRLKPRIWLRLEGDYAHTQMYSAAQNNFQAFAGVSYRF